MRIRTLAVSVAATLLVSSPAFAGKYNYCSPGFWKNHQELWVGQACTGELCNTILAALTSRGPGSDVFRHTAAAYLNDWADETFHIAVCTE